MSKSLSKAMIWLMFAVFVAAGLGTSRANAALYSYSYVGAVDEDCAVQVLGGLARCQVVGSFDLQDTGFGGPQFGLNADFTLLVNDVAFASYSFVPYAVSEPLYCVEYCNEVITGPLGEVTSLQFSVFPPSSINQSISLSETGWGWDLFETGNGLFSGATGAVITQQGLAPVPLPSSGMLLGAALVFAAGMKRRRR